MLHVRKMAGAQGSERRVRTPVRRAQGFAFASNRGFRLPRILAVAMISVGSPALSATYFVNGGATGQPTGVNYQGDAPASFNEPAGDSTIAGAGFSATASNLGGGSASVSTNIFIGDFTQYSSQFDLRGGGLAAVQYTIRIVGPATNALIPKVANFRRHIRVAPNTHPHATRGRLAQRLDDRPVCEDVRRHVDLLHGLADQSDVDALQVLAWRVGDLGWPSDGARRRGRS